MPRIAGADTETNYGVRRRTGGGLLAHRALSRLLEDGGLRTRGRVA